MAIALPLLVVRARVAAVVPENSAAPVAPVRSAPLACCALTVDAIDAARLSRLVLIWLSLVSAAWLPAIDPPPSVTAALPTVSDWVPSLFVVAVRVLVVLPVTSGGPLTLPIFTLTLPLLWIVVEMLAYWLIWFSRLSRWSIRSAWSLLAAPPLLDAACEAVADSWVLIVASCVVSALICFTPSVTWPCNPVCAADRPCAAIWNELAIVDPSWITEARSELSVGFSASVFSELVNVPIAVNTPESSTAVSTVVSPDTVAVAWAVSDPVRRASDCRKLSALRTMPDTTTPDSVTSLAVLQVVWPATSDICALRRT